MTSRNAYPVIPRTFVVAGLLSMFCLLTMELAGGMTQANAQQPPANSVPSASAPASDSAKILQETQKAAEEAKSAEAGAKKAEEGANNSKISTDTAASGVNSAVTTAQTAKADASDAAQKAGGAAEASHAAAETAKRKALDADSAAGVALNGSTNVKDNVDAQVVLLPRKQAERVFSKEIAHNYAVVQVTINNRSKDASFQLQSIFADYSPWALSGMSSSLQVTCPKTMPASQAGSCPGQVASVESRVIRGELQDASVWTWRNGIIRAVVLVGTVASGIPAFGSTNAIKYVSAYNGQFVPGVQVLWPDGTVPQLNRVSDFGFQTNKIVGKESADIVYAFFPVDRFLTPGMRNIFLNAPALFFAPAQLFIDEHIGKKHCGEKPGNCLRQSDVDEMKKTIEDLAFDPAVCKGDKLECPIDQGPRDLRMLELLTLDCSDSYNSDDQLKKDGTAACFKANIVQKLLQRISLNSINVFVEGVMTVDVTTVPASITDVTFDKGNDSADTWTATGTPSEVEATITGRFLTGGVPSVTSIDLPDGKSQKTDEYLDPKTISVVTEESADTKLRFKLQLKKTIPSGSKLHIQVTKYDAKDTKKASGVNSMDFVLPVNYTAKAGPVGEKPAAPAPPPTK